MDCDNKYHSDNTPVVALSTGWFNHKSDREIGQHNNKLYNRVISNGNKFSQTFKNL